MSKPEKGRNVLAVLGPHKSQQETTLTQSPDQNLATRVRRLRQSRGWTQTQLAEEASKELGRTLHFTTVAKIERDERKPSGEILIALARALSTTPENLASAQAETINHMSVPVIDLRDMQQWKSAVENAPAYILTPIHSASAFAMEVSSSLLFLENRQDVFVVVDGGQTELEQHGIYAIIDAEGRPNFKRYLEQPPRFADPIYTSASDAPVPIGREPFTIIGRVVWQMSRV
jgi:repressor LexA